MIEPTKLPNDEFLEELKSYVDEIPAGLAGAFALNDGSDPFAVIFPSQHWKEIVNDFNEMSDELESYRETLAVVEDSEILDGISESLASLTDGDLAHALDLSVGFAPSVEKKLGEIADTLSEGVKNFMAGPQQYRQIPVEEYEDMQKRISRQRKANFQLEEKYAELLHNFDDLRASFDLLDSENDKLTEEAEYWSHKYDLLVGAVNAVRSINIEAL